MTNIDSFIPFYFSATIGINLLCAAVVLSLSEINLQKHFRTLFLGCVVGASYQYFSWQYHEAKDLASALYWLKFQTSALLISFPIYYLVFVQWSEQKISPVLLWVFSALAGLMLIINIMSPASIRYAGDVSLVQYTIFSGETASRLVGAPHAMSAFSKVYGIAMLLVLGWISVRLLINKNWIVGTICSTTVIMQLIATILAILVDVGKLDFIYVGGLAHAILNASVCLSISLSLHSKSESLLTEVSSRRQLESVISSLAKGVSSEDSEQFYVDMTRELQTISGAKCAYLGIWSKDEEDEYVTTLVMFIDGKIQKNIKFALSDIPQHLLAYTKPVLINENLATDNPSVAFFSHINAQAMMNYPMMNEEGYLEGAIVLLFDHATKHDPVFQQTMEVFSSRAAAELKRGRLERKMHQMAYYDYHTKLPNLVNLHNLINECYDRNVGSKKQSILIVIDLDKFTEINRQYGFDKAEISLQVVGQRLIDYTTPNITIARSGGDEFSVLIDMVEQDHLGMAKLHWEAIRSLIEKPILVDGRTIHLRCSAGAVFFPEQTDKNLDVIRCAEIALSQAKSNGKHELCSFDINILKEMDRKAELEKLLNQALDSNTELFPVFQPKVDSKGRLIGAEALARWINKDVGFVSPVEFVAIAETSGFIGKLGFWMVEAVCEQLNKWQQRGLTMPSRVAINFSAFQLVEKTFVQDLLDIVESHNIDPKRIEIELTESGLLTNIDDCIVKLEQLRDAGFTIALDDFGTGYSSLSYLKDLPLDVLKIDRSFVNNLDAQNTTELARSIISIGQHMSMAIVAEGVEELAQVDTLRDMGCDIFQGYYFAKPMEADDFYNWAVANNLANVNVTIN